MRLFEWRAEPHRESQQPRALGTLIHSLSHTILLVQITEIGLPAEVYPPGGKPQLVKVSSLSDVARGREISSASWGRLNDPFPPQRKASRGEESRY